MAVSDGIHVFLMVAFAIVAVMVPGYLLRFRRSLAVYALCGMLWLVFAAGILAIRRDLASDAPLDLLDFIRLGAVACFLVFLLAYDVNGNGRRDDPR